MIEQHQHHVDVLAEVTAERGRQERKWGDQSGNTARTWITILLEEVGEVARASLEHDGLNFYEELIQVAAVAVAAAEYHRKGTFDV